MAATGLTPALAAGIDAGLAVHAAKRPQTIGAWRSAFVKAPTAAANSTIVRPTPRTVASRAKQAGVVAVSALGLSALVAGGYFLLAPRPAPSVHVAADTKPRATEQQRLAEEAREKQIAEAERRAAEEETLRRAVAESRRLADEARARAEAERPSAAQEAQRKAEAEARQKAEDQAAAEAQAAVDRKAAEAAETALRLGVPERQRLQVALTALGFDTHGHDGVLGPRSREMIAAWQAAHGQRPTGFLNESQYQLIRSAAAVAISRYDDEQQKQAEDRNKAEEQAKAVAFPPTRPNPPAPTATVDGTYSGQISYKSGSQPLSIQVANGVGTGTWLVKRCNARSDFTVRLYPDGNAILEVHGYNSQCERVTGSHAAHLVNNQVQFTWNTLESRQDVVLARR
jgi:peptidoglycan hydrolase-like protein with peptidoglycan-binding domain